jgi:hypothetical protein
VSRATHGPSEPVPPTRGTARSRPAPGAANAADADAARREAKRRSSWPSCCPFSGCCSCCWCRWGWWHGTRSWSSTRQGREPGRPPSTRRPARRGTRRWRRPPSIRAAWRSL